MLIHDTIYGNYPERAEFCRGDGVGVALGEAAPPAVFVSLYHVRAQLVAVWVVCKTVMNPLSGIESWKKNSP